MDLYYVSNKVNKTGKHIVHKVSCENFPLNNIYLGPFSECREALEKARGYYPEVEHCEQCCSEQRSRVFFNPR